MRSISSVKRLVPDFRWLQATNDQFAPLRPKVVAGLLDRIDPEELEDSNASLQMS